MTSRTATRQFKNILTLFIVLSLPAVLISCSPEPVEEKIIRPVRAVQVGKDTSLAIRPYPGRAAATEEVDLGFEVAGTVIERPVDKGDWVKKGQLLAKLDPRDFANDLKAARAERDRAKAYFDRISIAVKSGAVSKQDLTDAQARLDVASAQVRIKQKQLDDSEIIAPFDGIIGSTYVENFQRVRPKQIVVANLCRDKKTCIGFVSTAKFKKIRFFLLHFNEKIDFFPLFLEPNCLKPYGVKNAQVSDVSLSPQQSNERKGFS